MDIERIRALAALMEESGLYSLELCEGEDRLALRRTPPGAAPCAAAPQAAAAACASVERRPPQEPGEAFEAPLVGCVYLSPAPGAAPFVKPGDAVKKGQVLCIIEAMKVMNEYPAPRDGVITKVCVENGQLAEYGQALFLVDTAR